MSCMWEREVIVSWEIQFFNLNIFWNNLYNLILLPSMLQVWSVGHNEENVEFVAQNRGGPWQCNIINDGTKFAERKASLLGSVC